MKILLVAAACGMLVGCASITRGTTSQVTVNSEPQGAAVRTSMNHACPQTPCTFQVGRKDEFVITASKPGYRDASMPIKTRVAGSGAAGFAGNVLVGGLIGMGVDAATGATLEHFPNPIVLALEPIQSPVSREPKGPRVRSPRRVPASEAISSAPAATTGAAASATVAERPAAQRLDQAAVVSVAMPAR